MDKNIIIDGVNVAGCGAYKDKHCKDKTSIIFCDINLCSNYPYCYYKQLKRLEQENKELQAYKDINEDFKKAWDELNEKHKRYRSALEEIRRINNKWLKYWMNDSDELAGFEEIGAKINEVLQ
jgi:hypothetical protein